ncbi:MAG: N utilization substance protein B, partial [Treponemataceae bacterium]|nr:N utilization substance protein B [Treponemataceae bacterium]
HLSGWEFDRVNKVSLAILRMSVYALLYQRDVPASIVIDEAVSIAKDYGQDDSYKFINAVLDNIRKTVEN